MTRSTTKATTQPPQATATSKTAPAVSDEIAYGVPAGIVGLGIVAAVIFVIIQLYSKPVITIFKDTEIHEMKNVQLKRI